jgi:hypothetical protein
MSIQRDLTADAKAENHKRRASLTGRRRGRFFYVAMSIVAALVVFVGFSRTYYLKGMFGRPPLLAHVHSFLFTMWIVLFAAQAALVAWKRTDIHRRLGVLEGALAVLMICAGMMMAVTTARRNALSAPGAASPLSALTIPFFDIVVFAVLVAAAFYYRRSPQIHKRLMLAATIDLLPAAISRSSVDFVQRNGALAFFGLAELSRGVLD